MKLYATTTSERATKGQGGNDYLLIQIGDETGKVQLLVQVFNDNGTVTATIKDIDEKRPNAFKKVWKISETKGKNQKSEYAGYCPCTGDESMQLTQNCKFCGKPCISI